MNLQKNKFKYFLFIILIIVCFFFIANFAFGSNIFSSLYSYIFSTPIGNISATSCVIPLGASNCNSTLNWSTSNLVSGMPFEVTRNNPPYTHISFHPNSVNITSVLNHGASTFYVYYNGGILDSALVNASCAQGSIWNWNTSKCVIDVIDVCTNIDGAQASLPSGMYIYHFQTTIAGDCSCIPPGVLNENTNSCVTEVQLCENPPVCPTGQTLNQQTCSCVNIEICNLSQSSCVENQVFNPSTCSCEIAQCTKTCESPSVLDVESCSCKTPCTSNANCPVSPFLCGVDGFCQTGKIPHWIED